MIIIWLFLFGVLNNSKDSLQKELSNQIKDISIYDVLQDHICLQLIVFMIYIYQAICLLARLETANYIKLAGFILFVQNEKSSHGELKFRSWVWCYWNVCVVCEVWQVRKQQVYYKISNILKIFQCNTMILILDILFLKRVASIGNCIHLIYGCISSIPLFCNIVYLISNQDKHGNWTREKQKEFFFFFFFI